MTPKDLDNGAIISMILDLAETIADDTEEELTKTNAARIEALAAILEGRVSFQPIRDRRD